MSQEKLFSCQIVDNNHATTHAKGGYRHFELSWEERLTIAGCHASLHDDDLFALPGVQDWHACDGGAGLKCNWIHCVVSTNDKSYICIRKVVVDLVHFQNDCEAATGPNMLAINDNLEYMG